MVEAAPDKWIREQTRLEDGNVEIWPSCKSCSWPTISAAWPPPPQPDSEMPARTALIAPSAMVRGFEARQKPSELSWHDKVVLDLERPLASHVQRHQCKEEEATGNALNSAPMLAR